jgi:GNAT superfamily N-acetyltransferase
MTFAVRRATQDDREAIWTVHVRAIREICASSYPADSITAWAQLLSPDSYVGVLREHFFIVAQDAGAILGFGQLDQAKGEVEAVYVRPDRKGQGVGTTILSHLEEAAREAGLKRLQLSSTLNAVPFYERAGYAREGRTVHRLPTGVELPCVRMSKRVSGS